jgi:hypothetical protein
VCKPTPAVIAASFRFLFFFLRHLLDQAHGLLADLLDGKNLLHDEALRDHRFEFVEHDVDGVDLFAAVSGNDAFGQRRSLREFHFAEDAHVLTGDLNRACALGLFRFGFDFNRLRQGRPGSCVCTLAAG